MYKTLLFSEENEIKNRIEEFAHRGFILLRGMGRLYSNKKRDFPQTEDYP